MPRLSRCQGKPTFMNNSIISIGYWNLRFFKKKNGCKKWKTHTIPPELCTSYDYQPPQRNIPERSPWALCIFTRSPATVVAMLKTKSLSWRKDWSNGPGGMGLVWGDFEWRGGFGAFFFWLLLLLLLLFFLVELKWSTSWESHGESLLFYLFLFCLFFFF